VRGFAQYLSEDKGVHHPSELGVILVPQACSSLSPPPSAPQATNLPRNERDILSSGASSPLTNLQRSHGQPHCRRCQHWCKRCDGWSTGGTCRWYGARFPTEIHIRGCHWFPHLLASCSLQVSRLLTNVIPLGCSLLLPVDTVNSVQTL
jgi:hypothetical protein